MFSMARLLLIAGLLWASLPAALCEAACAPEPAAPMTHAEAMPCHGAPATPEPEPHDADGCAGCQLELAAASSAPAVALHLAVALAPAPVGTLASVAPRSRATYPPREPPGSPYGPFARNNAPLLN